ncbi:MAG: ABC transporter ATP-binding protein [Candidatus Nanoarchaeia archaeon]
MGEVEVPALRGLNFIVKEGEFVSIIGPSGSGKSTAMNMIGVLDFPSKGKIYLEGKDITTLSESDLAQIRGKKIGFIFQQFNLINTLSAIENVMLPMIFQGIDEDERVQKATKLLELVELGKRMDHKPTELSGGQQQRVAIARALANDPDVVLADEPTGNLDSKTGTNVLGFLKKLNREKGKTVVMVTHDAKLAMEADRIERLMDGVMLTKNEAEKLNGLKTSSKKRKTKKIISKKPGPKTVSSSKKASVNSKKSKPLQKN